MLAKCYYYVYNIVNTRTLGVVNATPKILLKKGEYMSKVAEKVNEYISKIVSDMGYEIVEVEFAKKSNGDNLTVFIDRAGGVSLEDCEKVHNAIDLPLDELDPTDGKPYTLNVSSPGLDRPIVSDRDYQRNMGEMLEIKLYTMVDKKKSYVGKLIGFGEDFINLEVDGQSKQFDRKQISKATKYIFLGE